jgi:hypothetical protein
MTSGFVSSVGLILDVCGAFFLSESFVLKKREETSRETASYWDGNPFLLRSAVYQTIEARVGFGFLLLGFFGQYLGNSGWFRPGTNRWPIPTLVVGVSLLAVSAVVVRLLSKHRSRRIMAQQWGAGMLHSLKEKAPAEDDKRQRLATHYSIAFDVPQRSGEETDAFVDRLVTAVTDWQR